MKNILFLILTITLLLDCTANNGQKSSKSSQDTIVLTEKEVHIAVPEQSSIIESLDTTMYLLCNIDSDDKTDTVLTRVSIKQDSIFVYYEWFKNKNIIWSENLRYYNSLEISKIMVSFDKFVPEIYNINDYKELLDLSIDFGTADLTARGYAIDTETYKQYLTNYNGKLIAYGHPENREGLYVWYEPLKVFVLFYRP